MDYTSCHEISSQSDINLVLQESRGHVHLSS